MNHAVQSSRALNSLGAATLGLVLGAFSASAADAATITYVNAGAQDSRVFVGFQNDASGYVTSDLVAHPSAASRFDTAYGPLPPAGQLANFDATCTAAAELGTNLSTTGTGTRSVFAPFNPTFFRASGQAIQASGIYDSRAFVFSGQTTSTTPDVWIVHVEPSVGENPGDPVVVTVDAELIGTLTAAGASSADVSWAVSVTGQGNVISGGALQSVPGTSGFSDAGTLQFQIPLGTTFELYVDVALGAWGSGAGAASEAAVDSALVEISAVPGTLFGPPAPVLAALAAAWPGVTGVEWQEVGNSGQWKAIFTVDGRPQRRVFSADGVLRGRP